MPSKRQQPPPGEDAPAGARAKAGKHGDTEALERWLAPSTSSAIDQVALDDIEESWEPERVGEAPLDATIAAIRAVGVVEPVLLRPGASVGRYAIVTGHRTVAAARAAGLPRVPAVVKELDEVGSLMALVFDGSASGRVTVAGAEELRRRLREAGADEESIEDVMFAVPVAEPELVGAADAEAVAAAEGVAAEERAPVGAGEGSADKAAVALAGAPASELELELAAEGAPAGEELVAAGEAVAAEEAAVAAAEGAVAEPELVGAGAGEPPAPEAPEPELVGVAGKPPGGEEPPAHEPAAPEIPEPVAAPAREPELVGAGPRRAEPTGASAPEAAVSTARAAQPEGARTASSNRWLPLPAGRPRLARLSSAFADSPRMLRILAGDRFTGTAELVGPDGRKDVVAFLDGRILATYVEQGERRVDAPLRLPSPDNGPTVEITVRPHPRAVAVALALALRSAARFTGLHADFLHLPGLLELLARERADAACVVSSPNGSGVILLDAGEPVAAYARRSGDEPGEETETTDVAAVLQMLVTGAGEVDVHTGEVPEPLDLEEVVARAVAG